MPSFRTLCAAALTVSLCIVGLSSLSHAGEPGLLADTFDFGHIATALDGWTILEGELERDIWVKDGHGTAGSRGIVIHTGSNEVGIRSERMPARAGVMYQAAAKTFATPGAAPLLKMEFWDRSSRPIAQESSGTDAVGTWQTLSVSVEAPPGTEWVTVSLMSTPSDQPSRILYDDVTLSEDQSLRLSLSAERESAIYSVGETVAFILQGHRGASPAADVEFDWQLSENGHRVIDKGRARLVDGQARIEGDLGEPGFLQLTVTPLDTENAEQLHAAVGVSPMDIVPSLPAPDGFDTFWAGQLELLAAQPATAKLTPVNSGNPTVRAFDVTVNALGAPVSGYLAKPVDAKPGSHPAIITLHGSGVRSARLGQAVGWAAEGLIALDINAHGITNGQPASYYSELANGPLLNYRFRGRDSRDTFYFREMFLRVIRAIDFITEQPEWDGRTLILYGNSQGGAQAVAGAGLDERVTLVVASVPAMADLTGMVVGRPMGWPRMDDVLKVYEVAPAAVQGVIDTLRYYDIANFAGRVRAEAVFTVGFLDPTCPPSSVYAAYNSIRTKKQIYNDLFAGHVNTPEAIDFARAAVLEHVERLAR